MSLEYSDGSEPRLEIDPSDGLPFFFGELLAQVYHFEKGSKLDFLIWAQKIGFSLGSSFLDSTHYYLGSYPFCNDSTVTPPLGLGWYLVIIQDLFGEDSTIRMRKYSLY